MQTNQLLIVRYYLLQQINSKLCFTKYITWGDLHQAYIDGMNTDTFFYAGTNFYTTLNVIYVAIKIHENTFHTQ